MPTITSKNTSVNSTKVPAIYNKIDWEGLAHWYRANKFYNPVFYIFDVGCGRNPEIIHDYLCDRLNEYDNRWRYLPYDPYWLDEHTNERSLETWYGHRNTIGCMICSNVLNVLQDDEQVSRLFKMMHDGWKYYQVPYFITIYEGDKSGVGKVSKADCWQRNMRTKDYLDWNKIPPDDAPYETVYKDVIVPSLIKGFIKK